MRSGFILLFLISMTFFSPGRVDCQAQPPQVTANDATIDGRWKVRFELSGVGPKNLIFKATAKGVGSFLPLDSEPDNKPAAAELPATWSVTTNRRVNFSGQLELPIGTCCREVGTLVFKGKFTSAETISGKAVFIGSTEDEENFTGYRSSTGTFTATRVKPGAAATP